MREGLHPDIAAQHGELVAAEAGDALEEGLLPGLQLDKLHALERLGGGVDAAVLHPHELRLDGGEARGHVAGEGDHEQDDHRARQRGQAQLGVRRGRRSHLVEEHHERDDDLEGSGPDGLQVAGSDEGVKEVTR